MTERFRARPSPPPPSNTLSPADAPRGPCARRGLCWRPARAASAPRPRTQRTPGAPERKPRSHPQLKSVSDFVGVVGDSVDPDENGAGERPEGCGRQRAGRRAAQCRRRHHRRTQRKWKAGGGRSSVRQIHVEWQWTAVRAVPRWRRAGRGRPACTPMCRSLGKRKFTDFVVADPHRGQALIRQIFGC